MANDGSERIPWSKRAIYGAMQMAINIGAGLPSQHLRRWVLRALGMRIGRETVLYGGGEIRAPWRVVVGGGTSLGDKIVIDGRGGVRIGDRVNISSQVMLWTAQHDYRLREFTTNLGAIQIEDYAWLGPRVIVLPGVTIRKGCVIAAAAVVTRDTEPFGVYAGIPARRVAERPTDVDYNPGRNYIPFI